MESSNVITGVYGHEESPRVPLLARPWVEHAFIWIARLLIVACLGTLALLLFDVVGDGFSRLSWAFLSGNPSRFADKAGIGPALVGSFYLVLLTVAFSLPVGVGAAIYLEEYSQRNRVARLIEVCIANLAGVPSIIYGLLGLQVFARYFGFGRTLMAGALTLGLLVLPIIIMASREAIRTVPRAYREGALALGATKWQAIWTQVLPTALPGILTGCILAYSRAIGETAPLVTLGALTYVAFLPTSVFSEFTALPIQSFNWLSRPQEAFHANAAAAITVLLLVMLTLNAAAIVLRAIFERRQR